MSKYYKLSVGIGIILLFPVMVFAGTYNDVSLTTDATISLSSTSLTVNGSADAIDSITVDTDHFSVTLDAGSTLTVRSGNRYKLNTDSSSLYVTEGCTDTYSSLTLSSPTGGATVTVTVTPDSNVNCSFSSGTSGSGSSGSRSGGGGGGGSSYVAPIVPVVVKTIAVANPVVTTSVTNNQGQLLTKDLSKGLKDDEVSILQTLLSSDKSIYPEGLITGLFGPATERAVKRFQAKYGISQIGKVGPVTRTKLAEVFSGGVSTVPSVVSTSVSVSVQNFIRLLSKGVSGTDVKALQVILNSDNDTRIADTGVGSQGNETETFGSLTEKALGKFQVKYGIANPGDAGYGTVGPKTRAKLNELGR